MNEEIKMSEVTEEIKNAREEELRAVIEQHFERVRTQGMKLGAQFIAAGCLGAIQKNLNKKSKVSLRDYERCIKDIHKIIAVQLTRQNDSNEADDVAEEE